jgi:hypothetical protein
MRRLAIVLLFTFSCCLLALGGTKAYLDHWSYMKPEDAAKRWGKKTFSADVFKKGPIEERAAQAADLVKRQVLKDKTANEIVDMLGPTSGYFWSDHFPTYFIEEGWTKKKDSWQLVFLLNADDKVTEIRIHKNCCYKKIPWAL